VLISTAVSCRVLERADQDPDRLSALDELGHFLPCPNGRSYVPVNRKRCRRVPSTLPRSAL